MREIDISEPRSSTTRIAPEPMLIYCWPVSLAVTPTSPDASRVRAGRRPRSSGESPAAMAAAAMATAMAAMAAVAMAAAMAAAALAAAALAAAMAAAVMAAVMAAAMAAMA
eukprot:scaffold115652_cov51-Phaeocystis_antarctica.AAC.1